MRRLNVLSLLILLATPALHAQANSAAQRFALRIVTAADVAAIDLRFVSDSEMKRFEVTLIFAQLIELQRSVGDQKPTEPKKPPYPFSVLVQRANDGARASRLAVEAFDAYPAPVGLEKMQAQVVSSLTSGATAADSIAVVAERCSDGPGSAKLCADPLNMAFRQLSDRTTSYYAARERISGALKARHVDLPAVKLAP